MGYVFDFAGHGQFDPDGKVNVADTAAHNAAVEAQELAIWGAKPDRHCAYVTGNKVATWLGTELGVVKRSTEFNTFGGRNRVRCIMVRGTNGAMYYGRYGCQWSQLVRLRKCK